jgi:hypothetical protein
MRGTIPPSTHAISFRDLYLVKHRENFAISLMLFRETWISLRSDKSALKWLEPPLKSNHTDDIWHCVLYELLGRLSALGPTRYSAPTTSAHVHIYDFVWWNCQYLMSMTRVVITEQSAGHIVPPIREEICYGLITSPTMKMCSLVALGVQVWCRQYHPRTTLSTLVLITILKRR